MVVGQDRKSAPLANASRGRNALSQSGTTFMLSVVKGIEPRDQIEAMLAAQMAAVHAASRLLRSSPRAHVESISRSRTAPRPPSTSSARTFAAQVEALKRYRSGGEQKMTVQHVHVAEGGQADPSAMGQRAARGGGGAQESRGATACIGLCTRRCDVMRHRSGAGNRADRQP